MKLHEIYISGYRGFSEFKISPDNLKGLTVIAGQNGTGKSTILEIIAYLLNSHDIGQIRDINLFQGITGKKRAIWRIKVSFDEEEIDYIVRIIREEHPYYNQNKGRIKKRILSDLEKLSGKYYFELELILDKTYFQRDDLLGLLTPHFVLKDKNNSEPPRWFRALQEKQINFAQYIKPFENIGELSSTYFSAGYFDPELLKLNTTNIDLRNRNLRTTINISTFLNHLATADIFKKFDGNFSTLDETLGKINDVVQPMNITYDAEDAKRGHLLLGMVNRKTNKSYPLQFASSGEKQVMGIVSLLLSWRNQPFKPIILIDEPEVHLHPEYVGRLANFFNNLFETDGNHTCLIASHSAEFIAENTQSVYQISSDSKTIEKVRNLRQRKELFTSLGKKFDLAYLTPRIIFVEGEIETKKHLPDYEIYQRIVDENKENKTFLPASSRADTARAETFANFFFKEIANVNGDLKIFAIVDSDNMPVGKRAKNIFPTPFKCVENAFIMESEAFRKAYKKITGKWLSQARFELIRNESINQFGGTLYTTDGKKVLNVMISKLKPNQNLNTINMQKEMIVYFDIERLLPRAKAFFLKIKSL